MIKDFNSLHPKAQGEEAFPLGDSNRLTNSDNQSALLGINSPVENIFESKNTTTNPKNKISEQESYSLNIDDVTIATLEMVAELKLALTNARYLSSCVSYPPCSSGIVFDTCVCMRCAFFDVSSTQILLGIVFDTYVGAGISFGVARYRFRYLCCPS